MGDASGSRHSACRDVIVYRGSQPQTNTKLRGFERISVYELGSTSNARRS